MTRTYSWTTARGAKISATITSEHITSKTVYADGWNVETKCSEYSYRVDAITVNGKATELKELWIEKGVRCILIARKGCDRVLVALPQDVVDSVYGEEQAEMEHCLAAAEKAEKEYNAHCEMMRKAMSY